MTAEKEATSPPKTSTAAVESSPATPAPKRIRMSSPTKENATTTDSTAQPEQQTELTTAPTASSAAEGTSVHNRVEDDDDLEVADDESLYSGDSALGSDHSDTTSIADSIYAGHIENGRRYQTVREGEYHLPGDEKQFNSMDIVHLVHLILDSRQPNPLFFSPIDSPQNILDVGTGSGIWPKEVADRFPSAFVVGVDLSPPPDVWVPPNCKLEVDDVLKPWAWPQKWDLIHIRALMGAFSDEQWRLFYKQAYKNLVPGGWIEQLEWSAVLQSDDGTLPADSGLAKWGHLMNAAMAKTGKKLNTIETFKGRIEAGGFTNIHDKLYKLPVGDWARDPILKEAGKFNKQHFEEGLEGYAMFLLTKFGDPEPWMPEEVQVFLAQVRNELNSGKFHSYFQLRRVWAQKPFDTTPSAKPKVEVENVAQ